VTTEVNLLYRRSFFFFLPSISIWSDPFCNFLAMSCVSYRISCPVTVIYILRWVPIPCNAPAHKIAWFEKKCLQEFSTMHFATHNHAVLRTMQSNMVEWQCFSPAYFTWNVFLLIFITDCLQIFLTADRCDIVSQCNAH